MQPIDVELTYDPSTIDERSTYAVRATIEVDGEMWWTSTQAHRAEMRRRLVATSQRSRSLARLQCS